MKTFALLLLSLLFTACGSVRTDGGQDSFNPARYMELTPQELPTYAQTIVKREERDPDSITLEQFRHTPEGFIKRIGLVIFETQFQPSRSGLSKGPANIYLSERGKQVLTEEAWRFWDESLRLMGSRMSVTWIKRKELVSSLAFRGYGSPAPDMIMSRKYDLRPDDFLWREGGKKIPSGSLFSPVDFQEVGLVMIPATEMMIRSKAVDHQKHWVNDICKALNLDAVLVVSSEAEWHVLETDKRTQEVIPEQMEISIKAAVLYPWRKYVAAATRLRGPGEYAKHSIPLASYSVKTEVPLKLSVPPSEQNFATVQEHLLLPFHATYHALANLVMERIMGDIHQTHAP